MRTIAKHFPVHSLLFVILGISRVALPQQTSAGPTLEETIAYLNSHSSHTSVTFTMSVSFDANLLVLQMYYPDECGSGCDLTKYITIPLRVISQVTAEITVGDNGAAAVYLYCGQNSSGEHFNCMHKRLLEPRNWHVENRDRESDTSVAQAANAVDSDQAGRIQHALTRLIVLLNERYQQQIKQRDPNDPFK